MPALAPKRLFTVDEYDRMGKTNILREDDRVELIEGEIILMTPIGSRHAGCLLRLQNIFLSLLVDRKILINIQNPIHLDQYSEPQPDVVLLKPREDFYESAIPKPSDIFWVVEVADTSLRYDRLEKIPLYGRCGIQESWVVDLENRVIEIYTQPSPEGYRQSKRYSPGKSFSVSAFPDFPIVVNDIFGCQSK